MRLSFVTMLIVRIIAGSIGNTATLYGTWVLASVLGVVIGQSLPEVVIKSFGVAFYASFLALLLPNVHKSHMVALLVLPVAVINTVLQLFLPVSWAVILSMVNRR